MGSPGVDLHLRLTTGLLYMILYSYCVNLLIKLYVAALIKVLFSIKKKLHKV